MDFLKTLLAYMAATFVVAVESTSTPAVTPVPTPAPAATAATGIVEMITEMPTEEITATPTVSVTPVPVPTITPNMKGYHNLLQGDRGDEVRKLQERLIELGYLPEGSADGAFGGKTRNAVRQFQYYNGLTVDGIAGRTTQTNLFENPDAAPKPTPEPTLMPTAEPVPTPEPTPTPTAEPVSTPTPTPTDEPMLTATPTPAAEQEAEPEMEETASESENDEAMKTSDSYETAVEQGTPDTVRSQAEKAAETEQLAVVSDPADTPEPTVTPYVVPAPTEIPWGDETGLSAGQKTEEAALETEAVTGSETDEAPVRETDEGAAMNPEAEPDQAQEMAGVEGTASRPETEEALVRETEEMTAPDSEAESRTQQQEEIIEEVDLDAEEAALPAQEMAAEPEKIEYEGLAGWVILNDSETALQWTETGEDTPAVRSPRMERKDDDYRISLDDTVKSIEEWVLHEEPDSLILEAQGYTLALLNEKNGFVAMVDGTEIEADVNDFSFEEGHFIRVDFLTRALEGSWEWDADEETLMIRIPEKGEGDTYR